MSASTARSYFEAMYENTPDPWGFTSSAYEARKYALSVASLPRAIYQNAFEPGCSVGVLTSLLAPRCERLLATDIIPQALAQAVERLQGFDHVRVEERAIPDAWPTGGFDLVVLSEIAYYFDEATLRGVVDLVIASTRPNAHVLGVHWCGETNYPLSGDRAHELIAESSNLRSLVRHQEEEFVLDLWERT
jgi:hypothetical protein